jgi:hypothetical protein
MQPRDIAGLDEPPHTTGDTTTGDTTTGDTTTWDFAARGPRAHANVPPTTGPSWITTATFTTEQRFPPLAQPCA